MMRRILISQSCHNVVVKTLVQLPPSVLDHEKVNFNTDPIIINIGPRFLLYQDWSNTDNFSLCIPLPENNAHRVAASLFKVCNAVTILQNFNNSFMFTYRSL